MKKGKAGSLIKKLLSNNLSEEEMDEFLAGMGDPGKEEEYTDELKVYFDDLIENATLHPVSPKIVEEASSITDEDEHKVKKLSSGRWANIYKWAAAIALLVSVYYIFQSMAKEPLVQKPVAASGPSYVEKIASRGSKLRLNLTDGSFIHLNADSKLVIPNQFNRWERHVDLSGEAYFKVSRDEHRPFTIAVKDMTVEVLGTSFNVRAYDDEDEISVTVESGKVLVKLNNADKVGSVILVKGQKVVYYPATGVVNKLDTDPYLDICWTKGILKFNKTGMHEVERTLERWYAVDIDVVSPKIYSYKLTGEHHNKNLKSVLEALKFALNIKYEKKGNHVILKL